MKNSKNFSKFFAILLAVSTGIFFLIGAYFLCEPSYEFLYYHLGNPSYREWVSWRDLLPILWLIFAYACLAVSAKFLIGIKDVVKDILGEKEKGKESFFPTYIGAGMSISIVAQIILIGVFLLRAIDYEFTLKEMLGLFITISIFTHLVFIIGSVSLELREFQKRIKEKKKTRK